MEVRLEDDIPFQVGDGNFQGCKPIEFLHFSSSKYDAS